MLGITLFCFWSVKITQILQIPNFNIVFDTIVFAHAFHNSLSEFCPIPPDRTGETDEPFQLFPLIFKYCSDDQSKSLTFCP